MLIETAGPVMESEEAVPRSLLELPDACLLTVLQCLAADSDNPASLASAARAHSRLHQAAVAACSSITARLNSHLDVDSLLLYLDRHGQHISSLALDTRLEEDSSTSDVTLRQLPTSLAQLSSLQLSGVSLQLQPDDGLQGVVTPGLPLKQLQLHNCTLLDGEEGLAAALSLLPGLEHLSYSAEPYRVDSPAARFPPEVLAQLPQLTYLELECNLVEDPSQGQPSLQPLQALSRLVDLRLGSDCECDITADMLAGSPHLTRLSAPSIELLEPGALAGKTALQHLYAVGFYIDGGLAGVAQLLSHVQRMQQLTHLDLGCSLYANEHNPPASAFSSLTASSRLQHLGFSNCILPAGVWQHVFPAGRQLPHLRSLYMFNVTLPSDELAPAPEGSRLVSCCPGLRYLSMDDVKCSAAHLEELQELHALRTLHVDDVDIAGVQTVGQLTQLRELHLNTCGSQVRQSDNEGLRLHLARLTQLTQLKYSGSLTGLDDSIVLQSKGPGDRPVWVQLLQLDYSDPDVAQQAAALLAQQAATAMAHQIVAAVARLAAAGLAGCE